MIVGMSRRYTVRKADSDATTVVEDHKFLPKGVLPSSKGKKAKKVEVTKFAYPTEEDYREKNYKVGKWVRRDQSWDTFPAGVWWVYDEQENTLWSIEIQEVDPDFQQKVLRSMRKAFAKDKCPSRYAAALTFQRLSRQYQDEFQKLDRSIQSELLQIPNKTSKRFLSGELLLDQYIAENALTELQRMERRIKKKEAARAAQEAEWAKAIRLRAADHFDSMGVLDSQDYVNVGSEGRSHLRDRIFDSTLTPEYGSIKIMMPVGQGEQRKIDKDLQGMNSNKMVFPTGVKEIIYRWWTSKCVERWLEDFPLAADTDTTASPNVKTMITLRRHYPKLYYQAVLKYKKMDIGMFTSFPLSVLHTPPDFVAYLYQHIPKVYQKFLEPYWVPVFGEKDGKKVISMKYREWEDPLLF